MTRVDRVASGIVHDVAAALSSRRLELILLPTEKCNFRCIYCYEDFLHGKMPESVVAGIISLLDKRADDLDDLVLSWFGGEPLLALDIVKAISAHVTRIVAQRPSLHYAGHMTTNAYLLNLRTASELEELGIRSYQITLDGPESLHDKTRVRADGKGTFQAIYTNLRALRRSALNIRVVLRVHITPENAAAMPGFLRLVREEFLDDPRFSVFLKAINRLGGPNDETLSVFTDREAALATSELVKILGVPTSISDEQPNMCYASAPNSFVIRSTGEVMKCTVALSDVRNRVGTMSADGSLNLDSKVLREWTSGLLALDFGDMECPAKRVASRVPDGKTRLPVLNLA